MQDMESLILQLKQQPALQEKTVLAIECTWDRLLQELDELLCQLGFTSFTYSVLTRQHIEGLSDHQKQRWENGFDIVGSLPDAVVKAYYRDVAHADPLWKELPEARTPLVVNNAEGGVGLHAETFWKQNNISSRVYVPMSGASDNYWFHYFGLFHSLPSGEFEEFFDSVKEWLVPILARYHSLLQVVCEKEQNPFLKQELLSHTCRQIIQMTAEGMAVKRIADKLALTEEGITYHITRAKRVFGARNKTQLVAILYEVGLL